MKKNMKVFLFILFVVVFCTYSTGILFAEPVRNPLGTCYETDIEAYLNGAQIRCFNTNGKTLIPIEELVNYGYDVLWDEEKNCFTATYKK